MVQAELIERTIANVFAHRGNFELSRDKVTAIQSAITTALIQQLAPDTVVSLAQAAREVGIHYRTLRKQIVAGTGPAAIKLTGKLIGIRRSELARWLDHRSERGS